MLSSACLVSRALHYYPNRVQAMMGKFLKTQGIQSLKSDCPLPTFGRNCGGVRHVCISAVRPDFPKVLSHASGRRQSPIRCHNGRCYSRLQSAILRRLPLVHRGFHDFQSLLLARQFQVRPQGQISSGAMIAIAPMGGFDTYLAAAIREKKTPVQLTIDPAQSAYLLVSSQYEWHGWFANSYAAATGSANWNRNGGSANYNAAAASRAGSTRGLEASLMLIDKQTGHILWAYEVHKSSHGSLLFGTLGMRGQQSIAEACAKHLKEYIEKGKG